jgi:release factor glutamine methyltransferase
VRDETERKPDSEAVVVGARRCRDAEGVSVADLLAEAAAQLERAGVETPQVDAELLLGHVLGVTRTELQLDRARELTDEQAAQGRAYVDRRAAREPLAYVLGEWGFRRLALKVDRRVLVPRPETEVVVERCLELLRGLEAPGVLDVGTGSGAIALAIADEHPGARVTAIDVSQDALALARENADAAGAELTFEQRDLRDGFTGRYDLVVSNPPYVSAEEIETLEPEVRDWEPRLATVGVEHTELIAAAAREVLEPGGWLVIEIAAGHGPATVALLRKLGYDDVRAGVDLAGRDRVVEGRWLTSGRRSLRSGPGSP